MFIVIENTITLEIVMVDLIKVQRLSLTGVHHKLMVVEAVSIRKNDDIVQPIWKHIEVHKRTDSVLRTLLNISVVFGMSAGAFTNYALTSYNIKYTFKEAKEIRDKYFGFFKDIAKYHDWIWRNYKKSGFILETALGRRMKPKLGTDAINLPVQGTGAETTKLGVIELVKADPEALKYIFSVVHDSIAMRVPAKDVLYWADTLEKAMLRGWEDICQTDLMYYKDIPIQADVDMIDLDGNFKEIKDGRIL